MRSGEDRFPKFPFLFTGTRPRTSEANFWPKIEFFQANDQSSTP